MFPTRSVVFTQVHLIIDQFQRTTILRAGIVAAIVFLQAAEDIRGVSYIKLMVF